MHLSPKDLLALMVVLVVVGVAGLVVEVVGGVLGSDRMVWVGAVEVGAAVALGAAVYSRILREESSTSSSDSGASKG